MLQEITNYLLLSWEEIRDHPHLMINAFDHDHRIILWNKKCEEYFHITEDQALGHRLEDLLPQTKNSEKMQHLERALMGFSVRVMNDTFDIKEGNYDQKVVPIKDASGKVVAALNIVSVAKGASEL